MTKSFEEKLEELEKLVKQLESDNVPLKEAVELYTQANILLKECNTELNDTKATIQKISEDGVLEEFYSFSVYFYKIIASLMLKIISFLNYILMIFLIIYIFKSYNE